MSNNLKKFDIFFLVDSGIGNAIEMLYALEHCMHVGARAGIFMNKISASFIKYVQDCYGGDVVLDDIDGVTTTNLVQSFTFHDDFSIQYDNYFYINPDRNSCQHLSETEQYLSIARSIYPSDFKSQHLLYLKENFSTVIQNLDPGNKILMYPGCSSDFPIKRWPYFLELVKKIGEKNAIIIGGNDDLNYTHSFYYPNWVTTVVPGKLLNKIFFFNFLKKLGLLKKHAQFTGIEKMECSHFNQFSWAELVALIKRAKLFIGNDGGISHLAGACGSGGFILFGPSSVEKNRTYNADLIPVSTSYGCQPCQFRVDHKNFMSSNSILCPYQLRCLYKLTTEDIFKKISNLD